MRRPAARGVARPIVAGSEAGSVWAGALSGGAVAAGVVSGGAVSAAESGTARPSIGSATGTAAVSGAGVTALSGCGPGAAAFNCACQ